METDPSPHDMSPAAETRRRLHLARLYALLDAQMPLEPWLQFAQSLVRASVDIIQLRDKQLDDRRLLDRARRLRQLTRDGPTLLIVNDRPDLAVLSEADGVHVGQDELTVHDVRRITGQAMLVGVSTHTIAQARQAVLDGADYIGAGPTFPSQTKQFGHFPGPGLLREVVAEVQLPTFAIGGINLDNLPQVLSTGCRRIAVSGALQSPDVIQTLRRMKCLLCGDSRSSGRLPPGW